MRTTTKLLGFGSAIGAAVMLGRRRRMTLQARSADPGDLQLPVGISEVDPQPLTQISAEGIDPDATRAAHDEPREQRARLPVHGQNLP
ncbi:MAG TPA: hypothetical protein VF516_42040 [Kofleriaceae bacterium]